MNWKKKNHCRDLSLAFLAACNYVTGPEEYWAPRAENLQSIISKPSATSMLLQEDISLVKSLAFPL